MKLYLAAAALVGFATLPVPAALSAVIGIGDLVAISGNAFVCGSQDDLLLLDFALRRNEVAQINRLTKSGACAALPATRGLKACQYRGSLSSRTVVVGCETGTGVAAKVQNLYVFSFDIDAGAPPVQDRAFEAKFEKDVASLRAKQENLRKQLEADERTTSPKLRK